MYLHVCGWMAVALVGESFFVMHVGRGEGCSTVVLSLMPFAYNSANCHHDHEGSMRGVCDALLSFSPSLTQVCIWVMPW